MTEKNNGEFTSWSIIKLLMALLLIQLSTPGFDDAKPLLYNCPCE
jgi:hypothetical protein